MEAGRIYHMDELLAAAEALTGRNVELERQRDELRGQLKEARRTARKAQAAGVRARTKSAAEGRYWKQLTFAAVGVAVAVTCLLHSLILFWGWAR